MIETRKRLDIMNVLKDATWELHQAAENHPVQQAFVTGSLSKANYMVYLGQMWLVHQVFERHLDRLRGQSPFQEVVRDYHFRETLIVNDLAALGHKTDEINALPATVVLIEKIERMIATSPIAALGILYVLEGSTNGSKFIARSVQMSYGLLDGAGTTYLDPHGEKQREYWSAFKTDMGQVDFTGNDTEGMVQSAMEMFAGITALYDDLP